MWAALCLFTAESRKEEEQEERLKATPVTSTTGKDWRQTKHPIPVTSITSHSPKMFSTGGMVAVQPG